MCGRTVIAMSASEVCAAAGVTPERWAQHDAYRPRFNATPGCELPVLHLDDSSQPLLQTMRWGLLPHSTSPDVKPDFWRLCNARSETITELATFRSLTATRRCVLVLSGYYEFRTEGPKSASVAQPYCVRPPECGAALRVAGLWDTWQSAEGPLHTATMLTMEATPALAWLHHRQPVVLPGSEAQAAWVGPDTAAALRLLAAVTRPDGQPPLTWHPVAASLAKPGTPDTPACAAPVRRAVEAGAGSVAALFAKAAGGASPSPGAKRAREEGCTEAGREGKSPAKAAKGTPVKGQRSVAAFFGRS